MRITAIVPVYNEEKTIGNLLDILISHDKIEKIIVVNDGSTDNTQKIITRYKSKKVRTISLKKNTGKGNAIRVGTRNIKSDIILFLDADLLRIKINDIDKLINPVLCGSAAMVIGLMDKRNVISYIIMPYFPLTGGQRAILTRVFMEIRKIPLIDGWGLESVMNDYCKKKKLKIVKIKLDNIDHVGMQHKKYGIFALLKQIYDVAMVRIKLLRLKYN